MDNILNPGDLEHEMTVRASNPDIPVGVYVPKERRDWLMIKNDGTWITSRNMPTGTQLFALDMVVHIPSGVATCNRRGATHSVPAGTYGKITNTDKGGD